MGISTRKNKNTVKLVLKTVKSAMLMDNALTANLDTYVSRTNASLL